MSLSTAGGCPPPGSWSPISSTSTASPWYADRARPESFRETTIVSIGGVPIDRWYAAELEQTSAGSEGYRYDLASRSLKRLLGPTEFGLRTSKGAKKSVVVVPQPPAAADAFGSAPSLRGAGALTDLRAPKLYYINVDQRALADLEEFRAALHIASTFAGLVVDLRGYPGFEHYTAARHLIQIPFTSPRWLKFRWDSPDRRTPSDAVKGLPPLAWPAFNGPIALLVGPHTVSRAENLAIMLVDAKRVTVIGRPTAATNGNITGVELPAAFTFAFTGMDIAFRDGSPFNGVGIVPDIEVKLTPQDFAAGRDPELEAAVKWLLSL
jgi:hypothetical protein